MNKANKSHFRFWKLACYAIGSSIIYSSFIAFTRFPPSRENLGETDYIRTWIMIAVAGATIGCITYCITWYCATHLQRKSEAVDSKKS